MDMVIIGAGGHGRVVLDIIRAAGMDRPVGFLDTNSSLHGHRVDGLAVLGGLDKLEAMKRDGVGGAVVAIGHNGVRREYAETLDQTGFTLVNAIHPSANVASTSTLGKNVVVAAGAVVCAHCQIGNSAILNTACIVDHESLVGHAAHVCPGARLAGRVIVESGAFVGIGATVIQMVQIGADAVVGAGAVVIRDVPATSTVVGVPARVIKTTGGRPIRFETGLEPVLEAATVS